MNKGRFITAKFTSKCAELNTQVKKGTEVFYDASERKVYSANSARFKSESESKSLGNFIQAQDDAFYDNFCQNNNI